MLPQLFEPSSRAPIPGRVLYLRDVGYRYSRSVRGQALQIGYVHAGDDRAVLEVRYGDHEGVHGERRAGPNSAEELPRTHPHPRIYWVDFDTLTAEAREDAGVGRTPPNDFREHCCHRGDRLAARAHRRDQGTHAIATCWWTVRHGRDRFTVEQQHQPM